MALHFRQDVFDLGNVKISERSLQFVAAKGPDDIAAIADLDQCLPQFQKDLLVLNRGNFRTESLRVVQRIVKEDLPRFLHSLDQFGRVLHDLLHDVVLVAFAHFIRIVELVQLCEVCGVRFIEILLYVREVDDIAIPVITIGPVDPRDGLEQVVVAQLASKVKALQPWRVKSCQQHVEDDQDVHLEVILEISDNASAGFLVVAVIEDQARLEVALAGSVLIQFLLDIIKEGKQLSGLFARFTDDHAAKRVIAANHAETLQI